VTTLHPTRRPALSGSTQIRVRYCECDPMGVAHHAAYAPWLEIARTELLRGSGVTYADMERSGVFLVITRMEIRYKRPIFYDDLIDVRTRVTGGSRVKLDHEYEIHIAEDGGHGRTDRIAGLPVMTGSTTLACVGKDGKIRELPEWLAPEA
jgi:acyl-CoA thioester hydrolase